MDSPTISVAQFLVTAVSLWSQQTVETGRSQGKTGRLHSAISGHLMLELEWLLKAESGLQCQTGAAQDEARWSGFRGRLRFDLQRSYDKRASGQFMTSPSNLDTPS